MIMSSQKLPELENELQKFGKLQRAPMKTQRHPEVDHELRLRKAEKCATESSCTYPGALAATRAHYRKTVKNEAVKR